MFGLIGALIRSSVHVTADLIHGCTELTRYELSCLEFPDMKALLLDPFYDGDFSEYTRNMMELPTIAVSTRLANYSEFPYEYS